jgi:hypothetical protein
MIPSMDVATGVLDICLGLAAIVLIAVIASRQRRRARSGAEVSENGAQRLVGDRGIAPGGTRIP